MLKLLFHPNLVLLVRIFLGVLFLTAGIGKLVPGFPGLMGPPWLEEVLVKYDLAFYARFIAFSQIVIGWMLLTQRFATLGAVMLLPMLLNILMVTISQNWRGTPYVVSVFILQNIYLLLYDFDKLKFLLTEETEPLKPQPIIRKSVAADLILTVALVLLLVGSAFGKTDEGLTRILVGAGFGVGVIGLVWPRFKRWKLKPKSA